MKKRVGLLFLWALLIPTVSTAQDVFSGTWKVDPGTVKFPEQPAVYLLQNGTYNCETCAPPIHIKADGQDQTVTGYPYFDAMNVKVIDDHNVELTSKKDGKTVATNKLSVSPEGNTLTFEFMDASATNADPVTGKGQFARVKKGPFGANAISGSWRAEKFESVSDNGLSFTYKITGETIEMTTPTGQSYTAKLDGTEAPYRGDPGTTSVSVKKLGPNIIEETDKRDDKVISVSRMTVGADGKTATIITDDKLHGTQSEIAAIKQ
jgi:hypothetical protein